MLRVIAVLIFLLAVIDARAIEIRLPDGTKVSGARVDRIEGNMAVIEYDGGVTSVPVAELPASLRPRNLPPASKVTASATPAVVPPPLKAVPTVSAPAPVTAPARAAVRVAPPAPVVRMPVPTRGAPRPDFVIDPLRGAVAVPPPTPPPAWQSNDSKRAAPSDSPGRVVVTGEAVPYIERFAEDEDNYVMRQFQENVLAQKKKRDAKENPKDIVDLPIYKYSPFRDPNKSVFQSPVTKTEDQFSVPSNLRPDNVIIDPYAPSK